MIGTPGPDSLSAEGGGGDIVGMAAPATTRLSSAFNRTALIGARGDDGLSTDAVTAGGRRRPRNRGADRQPGDGQGLHRAVAGRHRTRDDRKRDVDRSRRRATTGGDGDGLNLDTEASSERRATTTPSRTRCLGRGGDDAIDTVADARVGFFGTSLALQRRERRPRRTDGITVRGDLGVFRLRGAVTDNRVSGGGSGDDVVDATAINSAKNTTSRRTCWWAGAATTRCARSC